MTKKRIEEIKSFMKEIYFNIGFLKDKNKWEYEFLFNAAKTYGFSKEEMTKFIELYLNGKIEKKVTNKYKVIDAKTGVIYKSIRECGLELGLKFGQIYWLIKKNKDRFKLINQKAI